VVLSIVAIGLSGCKAAGAGGITDNGPSIANYTVVYDANGATSGASPDAQTKAAGTGLTLASNSGGLARTGYGFAGWNTVDDGSGTNYAEGAKYTADADVTLYAKWAALSTYTVSYDPNGADSGTTPADQIKTVGVDLTLSTNSGNLIRSGFAYNGWNTSVGGDGTDYAAGSTYSLDSDVVLYAKWDDVAPGEVVDFHGVAATVKIVLSWTAPDDADLSKYVLRVVQGASTDYEIDIPRDVETYDLLGVIQSRVYHLRLKAVDNEGNESADAYIQVST
jgi:uncharacterized repeat protein (TIGR02543 family)